MESLWTNEKNVGEESVAKNFLVGQTGMGAKFEGAKSVAEKPVGGRIVCEKGMGQRLWLTRI